MNPALLARESTIIPLTAAADQTGKEGYFVKIASGNATLVTAATDIPIGLIVQGEESGAKSSVAVGPMAGTARVKLAAAVTAIGTYLTVTAAAKGTPDTGSGARVRVARALETGSADELIECVILDPAVLS